MRSTFFEQGLRIEAAAVVQSPHTHVDVAAAIFDEATAITAGFASTCKTCTQTVKPGDKIVLHGRGFGGPGSSSHDGCIWDERKGPAPYLTWFQLAELVKAIHGSRLPDDICITRLLGAVQFRLKSRKEAMFNRDTDAALELGPDLLNAYRTLLKATGKTLPMFFPVEKNGATRWTNLDKAPAMQAASN